MKQKFDAFICHNLRDKPFVRRLQRHLQRRGYRCWLDVEELAAGRSLVDQLHDALKNSKCAIVVVGTHGIGAIQSAGEIEFAKTQGLDVVPVLAPGALSSHRETVEKLFPGVLILDLSGEKPDRLDPGALKSVENALGQPSGIAKEQVEPSFDAGILAEHALENGLCMFVGGTWDRSRRNRVIPDEEELSRYLMKKLVDEAGVTLKDAEQPPILLNEAARLYSLYTARGADDRGLWHAAISEFINPRSAVVVDDNAEEYEAVARILDSIATANAQSQGQINQIVFTTNIDVRLERALIARERPFTRITVRNGRAAGPVHAYTEIKRHASGGYTIRGPRNEEVQVDAYNPERHEADQRLNSLLDACRFAFQEQGIDEAELTPERLYALDKLNEALSSDKTLVRPTVEGDRQGLESENWIEMSLSTLPRLVIVKLCGSTGLRDGYALKSDDLTHLVSFAEKMPFILQEACRTGVKVMLGLTPVEHNFALVMAAFLNRNRPATDPLYLVHDGWSAASDLRGKLEGMLGLNGNNVAEKLGMKLLSMSIADFAEKVTEAVDDRMSKYSGSEHVDFF